MDGFVLDSKRIGAKIKSMRLDLGLTQEDFADLIGYSVRHLRRFESEGPNTFDVVNTIATALKVSVKNILLI